MARLDWGKWNDLEPPPSRSEIWGERIGCVAVFVAFTYMLGRIWGWW